MEFRQRTSRAYPGSRFESERRGSLEGIPEGFQAGPNRTAPQLPEEDLFVLYDACQQTDVRDRKLPVVVPVQTGEVVVVPREAGRQLARMEDSME